MSQVHAVPSVSVAPWAEVVADAPRMTLAEFLDYEGEDGYRYELVEGVLVRMGGTRPRAGRVTRKLLFSLTAYVQEHGLGTVTPPDEVYDFEQSGQRDTGLLPDIGFYHAFREPQVDLDKAYPFAPDLAVEVASPQQYRPQLRAKAARYLAGGTALVWVVWPQRQQLDVWHPGASAPTTLSVEDMLDGENVVTGFTFPVASLLA
ncbi:MAG TPA: Uma2 family endonuclease [Chloroflexota bacterium]|jgi:Uma2 family endonuclease